jgi:hypothetical protein
VAFDVTVSKIFGLPPHLTLEPATHISEALAERYLNGSQRILGSLSFRPSTYILQLDSAVTDSLPLGSVVRLFQPYFPLT